MLRRCSTENEANSLPPYKTQTMHLKRLLQDSKIVKEERVGSFKSQRWWRTIRRFLSQREQDSYTNEVTVVVTTCIKPGNPGKLEREKRLSMETGAGERWWAGCPIPS